MNNCTLGTRQAFIVASLMSLGLLGCGGSSQLPEAVTVNLPDGTQAEVTLGAGVLSLADTTWDFFQLDSDGSVGRTAFVRITFGPEGELASFSNNTFVTEIFGDEIVFDGERHATSQEGVSYEAATYGAETSDASGFTFVGNLNAFAPVVGVVAEATADATGTFDAEDPDVMTGSFTFAGSTADLPGFPSESFEDEMEFLARRVE